MRFLQFVAGIIEDAFLVFWMLAVLSIIFHFFEKKKIFYILAILSLTWLFIISVSPLPQYLIAKLEDDFPVIDHSAFDEKDSINILVLGGGHSIAPSLPATSQLSGIALARLTEALRISSLLPRSIIITSGYSASGRVTQAEMLQAAALEMGVHIQRIKISSRPKNTKEEIDEYLQHYSKTERKLIVVTSAFHMRRALRYFEKAGIEPVAAPAAFFIKDDPSKSEFDFLPSAGKIQMMNFVLHEYLGILEIKLFS
jgi:uncharacterized SAM-binding protein YcdF (DUF218 family)